MTSKIRSLYMRSKVDAINNAEHIRDDIEEFTDSNFGIDDVRNEHFRNIVFEHAKNRIDLWSGNAVGSVRAANSIHPKTPRDLEQRRYYQNQAIAEYTRILGELQHVADVFFDVDTSKISKIRTKIRDEISLIKKWRRSDEKR